MSRGNALHRSARLPHVVERRETSKRQDMRIGCPACDAELVTIRMHKWATTPRTTAVLVAQAMRKLHMSESGCDGKAKA